MKSNARGYITARFDHLYDGFGDIISVDEAAAEIYNSLLNEADMEETLEKMWPEILLEGCLSVAKSKLKVKAMSGGRKMMNQMRDPDIVFNYAELEDALIPDIEGGYVRFLAAKMRHLEAYRQRQTMNVEKMQHAYENYMVFMNIVSEYMVKDDITLGEALKLMGKVK